MHGFEFLKIHNELRITLEELSFFQRFLLKPTICETSTDKPDKDAD